MVEHIHYEFTSFCIHLRISTAAACVFRCITHTAQSTVHCSRCKIYIYYKDFCVHRMWVERTSLSMHKVKLLRVRSHLPQLRPQKHAQFFRCCFCSVLCEWVFSTSLCSSSFSKIKKNSLEIAGDVAFVFLVIFLRRLSVYAWNAAPWCNVCTRVPTSLAATSNNNAMCKITNIFSVRYAWNQQVSTHIHIHEHIRTQKTRKK